VLSFKCDAKIGRYFELRKSFLIIFLRNLRIES